MNKPDLTITSLIAWLRTKPPNDEYVYANRTECAFAQFLKSQGFGEVWAGGYTFLVDGQRHDYIPKDIQEVVETTPFTYGEALARASKIAAR